MFGLRYRIVAGVAVFIVLAVIDLRRHGKAARRWREYLFLLAATLLAMAYGALNDQFTSAISWEYFYYGKELSTVLGGATPPDRAAMRWQAARIGMEATWSVGLLLGASMLIANNPRPNRPSMPFSRLMLFFLLVFCVTALFSAVGGWLGWKGMLNWCSGDFQQLAADNLWRPNHFMACWGTHLGAYVGGCLGGTVSVIAVANRRRESPSIAGE